MNSIFVEAELNHAKYNIDYSVFTLEATPIAFVLSEFTSIRYRGVSNKGGLILK